MRRLRPLAGPTTAPRHGTRSRDSRTAASGRPTTWYAGRPDETWTSTVTGCPSTPMSVALRTAASTATSLTRERVGEGRTAATSTVTTTFAHGCDTHPPRPVIARDDKVQRATLTP